MCTGERERVRERKIEKERNRVSTCTAAKNDTNKQQGLELYEYLHLYSYTAECKATCLCFIACNTYCLNAFYCILEYVCIYKQATYHLMPLLCKI